MRIRAPDAPQLDFVFTVCDNAAGEACPVWPGQPMTAHWGMPDPAAAKEPKPRRRIAFAEALRMLTNRIGIFISLPLDKLDRLEPESGLTPSARPRMPPGAGHRGE